jgi:hypothetical protein
MACVMGSAVAAMAQFESVTVDERVWNDNAGSVLEVTNHYPEHIDFVESGLDSGANQHRWMFSGNGSEDSLFGLESYFDVEMDVSILVDESSPRQEAGFMILTNGWDGKFMVASDGEVAVFGNVLPFHTFGNIYQSGEDITIGLRYFNEGGVNKIEYRAGENTAVFQMTNTEGGLLENTTLGGYAQHQGSAEFPRSVTTSFEDIQAVPEPATMAVLGLGIAAIAARRRKR